jgi:hypothetical protein
MTKSEFELTVWADLQRMAIENIGNAKVCLSNIAGVSQYEDLEF